MQPRSGTTKGGKANDLQAQLLKRSKEVEELENAERESFELEIGSECDTLEEQSKARNDQIQNDQDNKLKALLARHARELADHRTKTDERIRQAANEALKAKNDQRRRQKEREAELELKFQERRRELKKKEEEADAEVARIALEVVKKQVASSDGAIAMHLQSSNPPTEITLVPKANSPLSKPIASPNTPPQLSLINFATSVLQNTGSAASPRTASSAKLVANMLYEQIGSDSTMTSNISPVDPLLCPLTQTSTPALGSSSNNPSTPRQGEQSFTPSIPTKSAGEERKIISSQNGYSSNAWPDVDDKFAGYCDASPSKSQSRSAKRPKNVETMPEIASEKLESQELGSTQKQIVKRHFQPAGGARPIISQVVGGQPSVVNGSLALSPISRPTQVKRSPSRLPRPRMTPKRNYPNQLSLPETHENAKHFRLNRVCSPGRNGGYFSWSREHDPGPLELRLEDGMYIPFASGVRARQYARWLFIPARVIKLEYNDINRMVKVIISLPGDTFGARQTHNLFGFEDGIVNFLASFRKLSPKTTIMEVEASSLVVDMAGQQRKG